MAGNMSRHFRFDDPIAAHATRTARRVNQNLRRCGHAASGRLSMWLAARGTNSTPSISSTPLLLCALSSPRREEGRDWTPPSNRRWSRRARRLCDPVATACGSARRLNQHDTTIVNSKINDACGRLESLLYTRPTESARQEVERALNSKWEGVQVWAGRVLASWGGRRSVGALRRWLEASMLKEAGWAVRGEAIRSLCHCYQPRDIEWILDIYFDATDRLLRHEFLPLIEALPEDAVRQRIAQERRSGVKSRLDSADVALRRLEHLNERQTQRSNIGLNPTPLARSRGPAGARAPRNRAGARRG